MYVLFLLANLKATFIDRNMVCHVMLPELIIYTKLLYKFCKKNKLKVQKCFSELFDNTNDNELLDRMDSLKHNHDKIMIQRLKPTPDYPKNSAIAIYVVHLRLWIDEIELLLKNEYIVTHFTLVGKIIKIVDYLKDHECLSDSYYDNARIIIYTDSHIPADDVEKYFSYLFYLIYGSKKLASCSL